VLIVASLYCSADSPQATPCEAQWHKLSRLLHMVLSHTITFLFIH
jgi:hypothetical protein